MTRLSGDFGVVGITEVVSASGVESWEFTWPATGVWRKQVTSVECTVATWDSGVRGRFFFNYWS
jgi:hypothetical protein